MTCERVQRKGKWCASCPPEIGRKGRQNELNRRALLAWRFERAPTQSLGVGGPVSLPHCAKGLGRRRDRALRGQGTPFCCVPGRCLRALRSSGEKCGGRRLRRGLSQARPGQRSPAAAEPDALAASQSAPRAPGSGAAPRGPSVRAAGGGRRPPRARDALCRPPAAALVASSSSLLPPLPQATFLSVPRAPASDFRSFPPLPGRVRPCLHRETDNKVFSSSRSQEPRLDSKYREISRRGYHGGGI